MSAIEVPIVGQAVKVLQAQLTIMAVCTCDPANQPFLLANETVQAQCLRCHRTFMIHRVRYDRHTAGMDIRLAVGQALIPS